MCAFVDLGNGGFVADIPILPALLPALAVESVIGGVFCETNGIPRRIEELNHPHIRPSQPQEVHHEPEMDPCPDDPHRDRGHGPAVSQLRRGISRQNRDEPDTGNLLFPPREDHLRGRRRGRGRARRDLRSRQPPAAQERHDQRRGLPFPGPSQSGLRHTAHFHAERWPRMAGPRRLPQNFRLLPIAPASMDRARRCGRGRPTRHRFLEAQHRLRVTVRGRARRRRHREDAVCPDAPGIRTLQGLLGNERPRPDRADGGRSRGRRQRHSQGPS